MLAIYATLSLQIESHITSLLDSGNPCPVPSHTDAASVPMKGRPNK
jgi:hypothetical protein